MWPKSGLLRYKSLSNQSSFLRGRIGIAGNRAKGPSRRREGRHRTVGDLCVDVSFSNGGSSDQDGRSVCGYCAALHDIKERRGMV